MYSIGVLDERTTLDFHSRLLSIQMKGFDGTNEAVPEFSDFNKSTLTSFVNALQERVDVPPNIANIYMYTVRRNMFKFIEQLNEVDVTGVEPMISVTPMRLKRRVDVVTDGDRQDKVMANAPDVREGFFAVPKVVE